MIVVLLLWILLFFIFFILGFTMVRLFKLTGSDGEEYTMKFEEYFFLGFLTVSSLAGILSILIPIGNTLLCIAVVLTVALFLFNYKSIFKESGRSLKIIKDLSKPQLTVLSFIVFFVLTAAAQKITWLDTQAYHAQNIQWIRTYAVVPGLGNLHDRFAFNSMFFVISALFTFQIKDILIFPLNGICFIVLIIKLFVLYSKEINHNVWKAVFYMLLLLISLLTLIPNLNTPSPDLICAFLTIYLFIMILDRTEAVQQLNFTQFLLFNLVIFTCVSYKISTLFLLPIIVMVIDRNVIKKSLITVCAAILIISPFLIRNFYLSGYLIYPFPGIDIFNVDWKIPIANVVETKSVIEGWAKIPVVSYKVVLNMRFSEWIIPWFKQLSFYSKLLVTVNLFSVLTFLVMLFRKDFLLATIQFIILINLIFWFLEAPDLRFAYGFIFIGFALSFAYIFRLIENSEFSLNARFPRILLACFLLVIIGKRIMFPFGTLKDPSLWIFPAPFAKFETMDYYSTNFHYRIPVNAQECFYTEIPCVTYQLNDVYMRGTDLQEGFKVVKPNK